MPSCKEKKKTSKTQNRFFKVAAYLSTANNTSIKACYITRILYLRYVIYCTNQEILAMGWGFYISYKCLLTSYSFSRI
ncbi:hypothetical protein HYPBUDRAFT_197803 [Hyphopichia burtonii NRRL Y-1933]|uniref:Uncharacterized protein n=1 Tax=Hyphopichia burtonii NRRL Y-1933 TaxID=984485 RepID=A0A1E4RK86_9ASCO|nr:hypothetical protein HYPBUDRAFT_197803 [Hyphopichia burtonii NRRL Y-1933]ODV67692.1 hypothetical protein HYPBUDRAFT_197803 [Hyphopichia burtonii NRRL Y-1933]